jgi:hypothetical protein
MDRETEKTHFHYLSSQTLTVQGAYLTGKPVEAEDG